MVAYIPANVATFGRWASRKQAALYLKRFHSALNNPLVLLSVALAIPAGEQPLASSRGIYRLNSKSCSHPS
jgi:hypothetical protein